MRIEAFGPEKAWREKREENEQAWKVGAGQIKASGYNLDSEALKRELMACFGERK